MAYRVSITKVTLSYYEVDVSDEELDPEFDDEAHAVEFAEEQVERESVKYQLSDTNVALLTTNVRRL